MLIFKRQKGFVLAEALVAIFIIIVGLVGILRVMDQTTAFAHLYSSRFTAAYLCQEGIEIVKNIRDANWLNFRDWDNGLSNGDYQADYNYFDLVAFNDSYLKLDNGFYNYSSGLDTKFKRKIVLESLGTEGEEIKVEVTVLWQDKGKDYSITAETRLFNWYGK